MTYLGVGGRVAMPGDGERSGDDCVLTVCLYVISCHLCITLRQKWVPSLLEEYSQRSQEF